MTSINMVVYGKVLSDAEMKESYNLMYGEGDLFGRINELRDMGADHIGLDFKDDDLVLGEWASLGYIMI